MHKFLLSFVFVFGIIFCGTSCKRNVLKGEGKRTTNTPATASFNAIKIQVPLKATIEVKEGSTPSVQFDSYENVLKHVLAKIENNVLIIYTDLDETWTFDKDDHIKAVITMPAIVGLTMEGAPDAEVHGNVAGSEFKVNISGASSIKVDNVTTDNFSVEVSGAADVEVKGGTVKHAKFEINGAGDVSAFGLQADEMTATISGAGSSEVTANQKLTASISGAGTIKYKGHPAITKDISGAGSITDAN
jgi:Putative auto-transporter adhesin, head GIN domain